MFFYFILIYTFSLFYIYFLFYTYIYILFYTYIYIFIIEIVGNDFLSHRCMFRIDVA